MLRDVARALRLRAAAQHSTARHHLERGVRGGRERTVLSQAEVEILLPHVRRLADALQVRDQRCLVGHGRELERRERAARTLAHAARAGVPSRRARVPRVNDVAVRGDLHDQPRAHSQRVGEARVRGEAPRRRRHLDNAVAHSALAEEREEIVAEQADLGALDVHLHHLDRPIAHRRTYALR